MLIEIFVPLAIRWRNYKSALLNMWLNVLKAKIHCARGLISAGRTPSTISNHEGVFKRASSRLSLAQNFQILRF